MRESLYREVEAEYEIQRAQNNAEEKRRLRDATDKDPMIGTIVEQRKRLFSEGSLAALANPAKAYEITEKLTTRLAAMQAELRDRLVAAGLPADYLQPVYACEKCHDTGHVGDLLHERCDCFTQRLQRRNRTQGGYGLDAAETFENFDDSIFEDTPLKGRQEDTQRRMINRVRALCEAYVTDYPHNTHRNLLLTGGSGLGKTYLLNCIGNRLAARGETVMKITSYQLMERMRKALFDHEAEQFNMLLEVPLLILDDLGAEPMYNNITVEQLFVLLNERGQHALPTIISSNLTVEDLVNRYTERITSRLLDRRHTRAIMLMGTDVRTRY